MKTTTIIAILGSSTIIHAGTPKPVIPTAPEPEPWIKPTIDIRARYEFGSVNSPASDDSNAFTVRERIGLITAEWYGFSAMVEGEFTQAVGDDYAVDGNQPGVTPFNPGQTFISDPETNELNQAWIQWKGYDTTLKGGRQRIILDNAAHIGNVGWRQNEQTFDAISFTNESIDGLKLFYSYGNRTNRIFGSDATGPLKNFVGDMHFFNATYTGLENTTLTAYAYLMDFDDTAANGGYISNNTYGMIAATKFGALNLRAEAAFQTEADSSPAGVADAYYSHITVDHPLGDCHSFGAGWEYLSSDFVAPLSTAHAFNGFADTFVGQRIGLVNNPGLNDLYICHKWKTGFWGINLAQFIHIFGDNDTQFNTGWEYDLVLSKKFNENFSSIAKFAFYDGNGKVARPGANDVTRASIELNYTF